jgi:plasmid replication initiation protein
MLDENKLIVKKNLFIEAKFDLTLTELKIVLIALSKIDKYDSDIIESTIQVKDIIELTNIRNKSVYRNIKDTVDNLIGKSLKIKDIKNKEYTAYTWFELINYKYNTGYISIQFNHALSPFLLYLKDNFTKYILKDVIHMNSKYSIRIYELLKQYEKIGHRTIKLEDLKELLCVESLYSRYCHFKSRILEPSRKEINKYSDLSVSYKEIKEYRKTIEIEFHIIKSDNKDLANYDKFKLIGMIQKYYFDLFEENFPHDYLLKKHRIILIEVYKTMQGFKPANIKSPPAFMKSNIQTIQDRFDANKLKDIKDW